MTTIQIPYTPQVDSPRRSVAIIDTDALRDNASRLAELAQRPLCMMLKANAYGHDLALSAEALRESAAVASFATATVSEALYLREAGHDKPIWALSGAADMQQMTMANDHDITLVIHHHSQLSLLQRYLSAREAHAPLKVWLNIDTGMHRLGMALSEGLEVGDKLRQHPEVSLIGLMSHYACADEPTHPSNLAQTREMRQITAYTDKHNLRCSFANSAALLGATSDMIAEHHRENYLLGDIARPGAGLYGLSPFAEHNAQDFGLKPAMQVHSQIIAIREIAAGEQVGYGHTWRAERSTQIATIGLGYGDGFSRETPSGWPIIICCANGHRETAELAGRVSMDLITIALPETTQAQVGDIAIAFGSEANSADALARHRGSISYTCTTKLTSRLPRRPAPHKES